MTPLSKKIVQRRRHRKQSRSTPILYRPSHTNGINDHKDEILPHTIGRTQSNSGLPLVCRSTTQNRLEKRMDPSHTTAHSIQNVRRSKSAIPTTHHQQTTNHSRQPSLTMQSNDRNRARNRQNKNPSRIHPAWQ